MTDVIRVVPVRPQADRRYRGGVAVAVVGMMLLIGGGVLAIKAAGLVHGSSFQADAAALPPSMTSIPKTHDRSLARVLPPVEAGLGRAEPTRVNLVSVATPMAPAPAPPEHAVRDDYAITLAVPATVRVKSATSFAIGGALYRLSSTDALGVNSCSSRRNGRCYRHPRADLKTAIAGVTLRCRSLGIEAGETVVDCLKATDAGL